MAKYDFSVHYSGEALEENRIPIRDLAPSLLALSETFQNIQKLNSPLEAPISLDIQATEKGSFIVDLVLTSGNDLLQKAVSLLNNSDSNAFLNLKDYVEIFTLLINTILQLAKHKLKSKKELNDGKIEITLDDHTKIVIPKKVLDAYQNLEIRKNIKEVVDPLKEDGISSIQFHHASKEEITITEEHYEDFKVPTTTSKELNSSTTTQYLQIMNVAFEHGKWRFSSGGNTFFAEILDKDFLKSVERNIQQFGSTDILKVLLETQQFVDKDGSLKSNYKILKVLEHRKGAQQIDLDFTDKDT